MTQRLARFLLVFLCFAAATAAEARYWGGLKDARPVSGPAITDSDLLGRIVLVYCFDADTADPRVLERTQALFAARDPSKFAVVGACKDETGIAALLKRYGVTYPVYKDFRLYTALEKEPGTLYFSNEYGRLIWQARDAASRRDLEKALAAEIARCGQPPSLTDGVSFNFYKPLKDKLTLGQDLTLIVKGLARAAASAGDSAARAEAKAKGAEAQRILDAIGHGREQTVANVRTLMDTDVKSAFNFLDLYLKSFPGDRSLYGKLYKELEDRAARER